MLAAVQKSKMLLSGTMYAVVNGTLLLDFCSLSSNTVCVSSVALVSNRASSLITLSFGPCVCACVSVRPVSQQVHRPMAGIIVWALEI